MGRAVTHYITSRTSLIRGRGYKIAVVVHNGMFLIIILKLGSDRRLELPTRPRFHTHVLPPSKSLLEKTVTTLLEPKSCPIQFPLTPLLLVKRKKIKKKKRKKRKDKRESQN